MLDAWTRIYYDRPRLIVNRPYLVLPAARDLPLPSPPPRRFHSNFRV